MIRERVVEWADHFIRLPVAGLDISDRGIKYVKFAAGGTGHIASFGEKEIAEGIIVEGRIERPADFAVALRGLSSLLGRPWSPMGVVASLPEEKSFLRLLQMPSVKPAEIAGALRWQIEGQIPLPAEDLAYDYEIIEPFVGRAEHMDIVITAYPKAIVDSYISTLKDGGFQPVALELESQAIARAVLGRERSPDATAIMDMGRNRTTLAVCAAGSVIFTSTVPTGGHVLEQEIAKALGVDMAEANRLKKEHGLIKNAADGKIFKAIAPTIDIIANEIIRTTAYYEDHISHIHGGTPGVSRVLMCGGDANLLGLDTYLASRVHIPVALADPFYDISTASPYLIPEIPRHEAIAFAAAIGLARRVTA